MNDPRSSLQKTHFATRGHIFAVAQLMRLANVFTAIADVWMGFVLAMSPLPLPVVVLGLTTCSCLLYTAGIVLNDAMDAAVDAVERPERPLPSGRVSLRFAYLLGWNLLAAGMLVAIGMSIVCNSAAPGLIAWALSLTIVAYNSWLKRTWLGPFALAACRAGNVLLGMSPMMIQFGPFDFVFLGGPLAPALGIGCYVCGIGWLAREEHGTSRRWVLLLGTLFMFTGLMIIASAPWWELASSQMQLESWQWIALWTLLGGLVLRRCIAAIGEPTPQSVQRAVGYALLLIIPIDAAVCLGFGAWGWACLVLALFLPGRLLSRWLRMT